VPRCVSGSETGRRTARPNDILHVVSRHPRRPMSPRILLLATGWVAAWAVLWGLVVPRPALAQGEPRPGARITFVFDGSGPRNDTLRTLFEEEIRALGARAFDLRFEAVAADYTLESARQQVRLVMEDPEVDLVIATGPLTSQVVARLQDPPHPVIASAVIDPEVQGLPFVSGASGAPGVAYLTVPAALDRDLQTFREIASVERVAFLVSEGLLRGIPGLGSRLEETGADVGIELEAVGVGTSLEATLDNLPARIDGVYVGPLDQLPLTALRSLADSLAARNLPSFAFRGQRDVRLGFMAGLDTDLAPQLARRVAVFTERILLGDDPATFPVQAISGGRLVINRATARAVNVYPPLGVLLEADVVGTPPGPAGETITLDQAMRRAVQANLALASQDRAVMAGKARVREAQSTLFPQLEAGVTGTMVDSELAEASLGQQPERTATGQLTLSQILYSDGARANVDIEQASQSVRVSERATRRLDVALEAAEAYLNVLRAEALVEVQRDNLVLTRESLELADQRQAVGTAGPAEALRLQAEIATRRTDLINAFVQLQATRIALNQVLNRPLEAPFTVAEDVQAGVDALAPGNTLVDFVTNPRVFEQLRDFLSVEAVQAEPVIQALEASIRAQERAVRAAGRSFYLPTVAAIAQLNSTLYEAGAGTDGLPLPDQSGFPASLALPEAPNTFWTVGVNVTLPLFQGAGRVARRSRAAAEAERLRLERDLAAQRIEQNVRTQLQFAAASYAATQEARRAADAAQQSLDIVTDSYAAGALDVTPLLESQTAAQQAEIGVTNATYNFLVDLKRVERAISRFEALSSSGELAAFRERLGAFLRSVSSEE